MSNNTVAIYCKKKHNKLIEYVNKKYDNIISLYDTIESEIIYDIPRFHYTEINNYGITIIIDDLSLYDRLKNKNNTIIYYMHNNPNHNINYQKLLSIMEQIDGVLLFNKNMGPDAMKILFNYTKELLYV